MCVKTAI